MTVKAVIKLSKEIVNIFYSPKRHFVQLFETPNCEPLLIQTLYIGISLTTVISVLSHGIIFCARFQSESHFSSVSLATVLSFSFFVALLSW